ncbi:hypothetical protein C8Q75DRAFT_499760 [Abortiporus biennis]|nr:hypothetical protein C8Q75DRAFT_499760 [Abortiporus biennis]
MSDTGDDHGVDFRATAPSTIYPACLSILENVPCAESVPLRSELQALFEKGIRMNDHCMPRVLKTTCKGEGPLSLRSRVYWPSELGQHAILVSPAERYQQDEKWEPYNELQAYAGRTYELFYNDDDADGKISYAGTYKCLSITTLPSECYEKLPDSTCRELFRIARQRHNIPFNWRKRFNNDFVFGERQISFLPLQCIGFNHVLYDKIIAKNQKNSLKRKGVSSDSGTLSDGGEGNKKARDAIDELI